MTSFVAPTLQCLCFFLNASNCENLALNAISGPSTLWLKIKFQIFECLKSRFRDSDGVFPLFLKSRLYPALTSATHWQSPGAIFFFTVMVPCFFLWSATLAMLCPSTSWNPLFLSSWNNNSSFYTRTWWVCISFIGGACACLGLYGASLTAVCRLSFCQIQMLNCRQHHRHLLLLKIGLVNTRRHSTDDEIRHSASLKANHLLYLGSQYLSSNLSL